MGGLGTRYLDKYADDWHPSFANGRLPDGLLMLRRPQYVMAP